MIEKKDGVKKIPKGGIIPFKESPKYKTGNWKTKKPIVDKSKCIHCGICVVYCPENCIMMKNGKVNHPDLEYCKGCGICAKVCPVKCIKMVKEECENK